MAPAGQRLEPGDGPVLEPHDRAEQHHDLAALERVAHIVFERLPVRALRAHDRREQLDAVAARLLGVGERELRVGEQVAALDVELRIVDGGADRDGQRDLALAEADRGGERRAQGVEPLGEIRARQVGEDDHAELVAAEARQRVAGLQVAREPAGDREQRRIAHRQAVGIVDPLEIVDVDHQRDRRRGAGLLRQMDGRVEPVVEQLAVRQARQVVVDGVVEHALLGRLDLGDVGERADDANDLAVRARPPAAPSACTRNSGRRRRAASARG